jgi:hypothetical protein
MNDDNQSANIIPTIDLARIEHHHFPKPYNGSSRGYIHVDDLYKFLRELGVNFVDTTGDPTAMDLVRRKPIINISSRMIPGYVEKDDYLVSRSSLRESLCNQGCRVIDEFSAPEPDANCVTSPDGGCVSDVKCMRSSRTFEIDKLVAAGHFIMHNNEYHEVYKDVSDSVILYHHPAWPNKEEAGDTTLSLKA